VQQATYDDGDGTYTLMLLNTPGGTSPLFRTTNLQMARLTEEDTAKGEKTAVEINGDQATLYMTEDFKIEYVHNVTEVRNNPQTGQQETVVIRQESSFWSPFFGAVAGQALGSLLFRPQYYVPPLYTPGGVMTVLLAIYVVILVILPLVPIAAPPPQNPVVPVMVRVP